MSDWISMNENQHPLLFVICIAPTLWDISCQKCHHIFGCRGWQQEVMEPWQVCLDCMFRYRKYSKTFPPGNSLCWPGTEIQKQKPRKGNLATCVYKYISIRELETTMMGVLRRLLNQTSLNQSFAELVHSLTVHVLMVSSYMLLIINIQNY